MEFCSPPKSLSFSIFSALLQIQFEKIGNSSLEKYFALTAENLTFLEIFIFR